MHKDVPRSELSRIVTQLKNLPEDERLLLSLYLYEGLTSQQVQKVLHHNGGKLNRSRRNVKSTKYKKRKTVL